jgi:thiosulfate/3-mercaptopyruvate sulfurtransferase
VYPLLLDPLQLNDLIHQGHRSPDQYILVDLGDPLRFEQTHIPGAIPIFPMDIMFGTPPAPGLMPSQDNLTSLFQSIGLTPNKQVIVYDEEGGGWAGRFIWLLDSIGHPHYSYLDGGFKAWLHEGLETTSANTVVEPSSIEVIPNSDHTVTAEDIIQQLPTGNAVIWDARSPAEYAGTKVLAKKGGHIPGAFNYEWTKCMDPSRGLRIRDHDELRCMLNHQGAELNRPLYTHCQTHHRSGLTYLVAKILGFNKVSAYAGSWSEWGNRDDTPIDL